MIERFPAPDNGLVPVCYGLSHGTFPNCSSCLLAPECKPLADGWRNRKTLNEELAALENELATAVDVDGILDPMELYAKLYAQVFGRALSTSARKGALAVRTLYSVQSFCSKEGIPLAAFISANMYGLKDRLTRASRPFFPNMLLGNNALVRYNIFIKKAESRLRSARADAFDSKGELGKLLSELTAQEIQAGEDYVAVHMLGEPATPPPSISPRRFARFGQACARIGPVVVLLRALVYVVEQYGAGLADCIGFNDGFSWEGLAGLLLRSFGLTKKRENPVLPVSAGVRHW